MKNLTQKGTDGAERPVPNRMNNMEKQMEICTAVIGGGAAGLLAAGRLAQRGRKEAHVGEKAADYGQGQV